MKDSVNIDYIWQDRKRYLGLPISFTKYAMSNDRIFIETGLFNTKFEEVLLYRVQDISLQLNFTQKIFGVGSVIVHSADKTNSHLEIKNIKNPRQVRELLHQNVEKAKTDKGIRIGEYLGEDEVCSDC